MSELPPANVTTTVVGTGEPFVPENGPMGVITCDGCGATWPCHFGAWWLNNQGRPEYHKGCPGPTSTMDTHGGRLTWEVRDG